VTAAGVVPPARLLVVDDNEVNRDLLSRRLRRLGHDVELAASGGEALARMAAGGVDLVLLDVMMPEMSGYEVLERLRASDALRHVPVIMVSALDELASVVRCIELGAADYLPKPFEPVLLKARVGACLESKRMRDRERLHAESLERELEIGREIQRGFFPERLPQPGGWEVAALFESARQVAGDFYDAFPLDERRVALVVGDVCDKGVGAALFMALFRSLLRAVAEQAGDALGAPPAGGDGGGAPDGAERLLRAVRVTSDYIARVHSRANMFATLFVAALDPATGALAYVNAGHEPALVVGRDGRVRAELEPTGPAAGLLPDVAFGAGTARLEPGETLLVYTDGVSEARAADGAFFGDERLRALLAERPAGAAALLARLAAAVAAHAAGAERSDDITALAATRAG
jgi:serine phosphatase RsbU (regulator of sigma subunit)